MNLFKAHCLDWALKRSEPKRKVANSKFIVQSEGMNHLCRVFKGDLKILVFWHLADHLPLTNKGAQRPRERKLGIWERFSPERCSNQILWIYHLYPAQSGGQCGALSSCYRCEGLQQDQSRSLNNLHIVGGTETHSWGLSRWLCLELLALIRSTKRGSRDGLHAQSLVG